MNKASNLQKLWNLFKNKFQQLIGSYAKEIWIRSFIKWNLRYAYKRGCDRNIQARSRSSAFLQAIFGCKVLKVMYDETLIINIDESWFSRSVKSQYFWLPRNKSPWIINVESQGRWTLIWALMSDGDWIWMFLLSTTTSQDFWLFLYTLKIYLNWRNNNKEQPVVLTFDNASIHCTAKVKSTALKLGMRIIGLPTYWPHLVQKSMYSEQSKGVSRALR